MKKLILLVILISYGLITYSQSCDSVGVDKHDAKKIINQEFGSLINGSSKNNIGNYASFDTKDSELNFNGNVMFKNGSILGIKMSGGIGENIFTVFNNDEFNSKFGLDIQYNFLDFTRKKILYDNESCVKYKKKQLSINQEYELKELCIKNNQDSILLVISIENQIEKLSKLKSKKDSLNGLSKDSLVIEIKKKELALKNDSLKLNNLPSTNSQLFSLDNWKAKNLKEAKKELEIYGYQIGWFSIGFGVSNNSFKLLTDTLPISKQITKESFLSHNFRVQYNFYYKNPIPYKSIFLTIGADFGVSDNFSSLTKTEINERTTYGSTSDERYSIKKYNAYTGSYEKDLKTLSFYSDIYWFLFEDNKGAIHISPRHIIKDKNKPSTNLSFGFLLSFKDKAKENSIVNAELFADFKDLANNNESKHNIFIRSAYGARFSFPINFNNK